MTSERHWLPSIPALVFAGTLAFVVFVFQEPLLNSDGDLARHLRHGEYMLQHHALIRADPFSYTMAGKPFVAYEYGSQLVFAVVHRVGGLAGVTVLAGLLIAAAYALVARYMLRRGVDPALACAVTLAAATVSVGHWLARPHLVTLAAVPILLELLSPVGRPRLWPFPLLFAVWANLHAGFLYGLIVIGIFLAAAALRAVRYPPVPDRFSSVRFYSSALALAAVATLLTPNGFGLHRQMFATVGNAYVMNHTSEFASPDFHEAVAKLFMWVMLAALAAAMLSRRRVSVLAVLLTLAGIDLALVFQRNIPFFALTALPLLAVELDAEWRGLGLFSRARSAFEAGSRGASTVTWIAVTAGSAAMLGALHGRLGHRQLIGDEFSRNRLPVPAVARAREAGLTGRLFSDFTYGGYVLYAWPEQKVFIDGGTDFYGSGLMRDYATIRGMRPGWRELMRRWDLAILLVRPAAPLAAELAHEGGWTYWYCDPQAVILLRADVARSFPPPIDSRPTQCAPASATEESAS